MFPHTNKMVFYWQRSHLEVVSMVTDAWAVCQTVRRSLVRGWGNLICRQENLLVLLIHAGVLQKCDVLLHKAWVPLPRPAFHRPSAHDLRISVHARHYPANLHQCRRESPTSRRWWSWFGWKPESPFAGEGSGKRPCCSLDQLGSVPSLLIWR